MIADSRALRRVGGCGSGVERTAFSVPDMEAREWLRDRFAEAGLDASIDGVGNVHGRSRASGPAILLGSHSDAVPRGGCLDGALGVAYALEAARAWRRAGAPGPIGLDVVSFAGEESTFARCLAAVPSPARWKPQNWGRRAMPPDEPSPMRWRRLGSARGQ